LNDNTSILGNFRTVTGRASGDDGPFYGVLRLSRQGMARGRSSRCWIPLLGLVVWAWLWWSSESAMAGLPEYIAQEEPVFDNAMDLPDSFEEEFKKRLVEGPFFPRLKESLEPLPAFFRDTRLDLNTRTYYRFKETTPNTYNEAWATGGSVSYESGWLADRIKISGTFYTSQPCYAPPDRNGSGLLTSDGDAINVLGQAYAYVSLYETIGVRAYRQAHELPYLNKYDTRMVPNTFESYVIGAKGFHNTDFIVGYIDKMKPRDQMSFQYMSAVAGAQGTARGLAVAGARYNFTERLTLAGITEWGFDTFNTVYAETNYKHQLTDQAAMKLSGQYTYQGSVGDQLAGDFTTFVFGAQAAFSYCGAILSLAFSITGNGADISSPFGGYPGYLSLMISDFDRAGEKAWLVGLSYDFARIGLKGLSGFVNYAQGYTPQLPSGPTPNEQEIDVTLDYRVGSGMFRELWLRARYGYMNQWGPGAQNAQEVRVTVNFPINLL